MARASAALLHNWRLKLSALGLAIFFWSLVQTDPRESEIFPSVPIVVEVADTLWTLSGAPGPGVVELRLSGPAREIIQLARDGATLRVPIDGIGSGDTLVTLRREWVDLGGRSGLTVESVTPAEIELSLERAMTKTVPVVIMVQGDVPGSRALSAPLAADPAEVRVRGARSLVSAVDSLPLRMFDLSLAQQSDLHRVPVDTAGVAGLSITPATIVLGVRVEDRMERAFPGLPVEVPGMTIDPTLRIEPTSIGLRVTGASTLVSTLDPAFVRIWVDPESLLNLLPGEERTVAIRVDGIPDLVTAVPATDVVTVRRETDGGGGGASR